MTKQRKVSDFVALFAQLFLGLANLRASFFPASVTVGNSGRGQFLGLWSRRSGTFSLESLSVIPFSMPVYSAPYFLAMLFKC